MKEMTKAQIQERQLAVWDKIDEMDEMRCKRENPVFTEEENIKYDALLRESNSLSARAEQMASGKALEGIREHKSKNAILREFL